MRGILKFLFSLVIGVGIIWAGFWWYAEGRLQSGFTAWADKQATDGWKISYDSLNRGTSLMDASIHLTNLTLTPPDSYNGETATIVLPTVVLRIDALNPLVFHTDLPNKISLILGSTINIVINTGKIRLSENLDPNTLFNRHAYPFRGGDFSASNIDILASEGSLLVLHIDQITSHADLNLAAPSTATAIASTTSLDNLVLSPLLTRIANIPFGGKITHLAFSGTFSGPIPADLSKAADQLAAVPHDEIAQQKIVFPIIHNWASQGGNGSGSLNLAIGPSTAQAGASLKFDPNLQPTGAANLTANHLDQFTSTILNAYPSLANSVAQIEAALSPYITTTDQGGQSLAMHVTYGPGAVTINGQKVSNQPPLDWNTLENPPPPPIQAPGDGSGAALAAPSNP